MAIVITNGTTVSVVANTKNADSVTGTYQFVGKGLITLAARGSAAGINATLLVGGIAIIQDQPVSYFGTTGGLSINDHIVAAQMMNGGKVELFFRNTTAGNLTVDFSLLFG